MFDLGLTDEERMIRETARRFAEERLAGKLREHERAGCVPAALADEFAALGLGVVDLPESLGGQGAGTIAKTIVLEELGAADAGAALAVDRLGLAAYPLSEAGLVGLIGEILSAPEARACTVVDAAERFVVSGNEVSGTIPWVATDRADVVVVLQPREALVVQSGIELRSIQACGLEAAGSSELGLRGAAIVARVDEELAVARGWSRSRVHVAALLVGAAPAACEYATRYATERTAFGRPIAHHQALAFLLVDMATAVDVARLAVRRAAIALDDGGGAVWESASALAEAAEQALFVAPNAVQVLGGHGFMKDHPVEKLMRDVRTLAQLAGGRDQAEIDAASLVAAREVGLT